MITKVVGVTFRNDDGTSRERIIGLMSASDKIILKHEPTNPYDRNAVMVFVQKDNGSPAQIGYLSREIASIIAPKLKRNELVSVQITSCGFWYNRPYCELMIS